MTNLKGYLRIKEASILLGVSPMTLRNWDKQDKLKPHRNPINGYRLYKKEDLLKVLGSIESDSSAVVTSSFETEEAMVRR
ncbi:MAG: helix-turn-helix domain-containing protein [Candidatus Omnitrophota bacterium]